MIYSRHTHQHHIFSILLSMQREETEWDFENIYIYIIQLEIRYVFYGIIGEGLLPGLSFTSLYLQVKDSVNIFLLSSCLCCE